MASSIVDQDGAAVRSAPFECRDIGYGVETGTVVLPAVGGPDWTGKREYVTADGVTVYLFDDEVAVSPEPEGLIGCASAGCRARFFFVAARDFPWLCLDHAADASRERDGWTPGNSLS